MTPIFEGPGPHVFDIPAGQAFARELAEGLLTRIDPDDPMALARMRIFAPTRRGARMLTEALVAAAGRTILAPRIETLADLDDAEGLALDLPPAIAPTRRLLALTRLVRKVEDAVSAGPVQESVAVAMARDLAQILDQVQGERLDLDALEQAVPGDHAGHWARSLRFLDILREVWPAYLAETGSMDPVARRAEIVSRQIAGWQEEPPQTPVIVAGSTGSVGISAELIAAVARLPQGAVILPGLDRHLGAADFASLRGGATLAEQPDHPQAGLSRLLGRLGTGEGPLPRDAVRPWRGEESARKPFLSIAMRPAPVTDSWAAQERAIRSMASPAMESVVLIEAETSQEEALAVALAMRETLETPRRTVALISTDRMLTRRVAAALARWGIEPDDSGGAPLSTTPPGVLLLLAAEEALAGSPDPVRFLALAKHPLCALGHAPGERLERVRRIEIEALRAGRKSVRGAVQAEPAALRGVFDGALDADAEVREWLDAWEAALAPLARLHGDEVPFGTLIAALIAVAEALSASPDADELPLWQGPNGEAARAFLDDLAAHGDALGPVSVSIFPQLLAGLMSGRSVRAPFGQHPRALIWGTLEARMQATDRVILAGLNEQSWPRLPDPDPWMSRSMRRSFGLPPLERRIGLSAHDFQQAFCGADVVLSRSRKVEGAPTVPSRWLQRITTLLGDAPGSGYAPEVLAEMRERGARYRRWAASLAEIEGPQQSCARPAPTPPLERRPRRISATQIETLIRDPYALYARKVLDLYPLRAVAAEPDHRIRGIVMHEIVEHVVRETMAGWPDDPTVAKAVFETVSERILAESVADWPSFLALYRLRAQDIGRWLVPQETARRERGEVPLAVEPEGELEIAVPLYGSVRLTAIADRIDRLADGSYAVYDYKGSSGPTVKQVEAGFAQQLPVEGLILSGGGFAGVPAAGVSKLAYLKMLGGKQGGKEIDIPEAATLVVEAIEKVTALLAAYGDPARGYLSRSRPESLKHAGDYDHLARVGEWAGSEADT